MGEMSPCYRATSFSSSPAVTERRSPTTTFHLIGVLGEVPLWAFYMVGIVWWVNDLQLTAFQLIMLGTALEVSALIAEVPTGALADRFGRGGSVLVSFVLMGVSMIVHGATTNYAMLVLSQVLVGIGWTFRSGADVAWLSDQFGESTETDDLVGKVVVRRHLITQIATAATMPFVVLLGWWSLRGTLMLLGVFLLVGGLIVRPLIDAGLASSARATDPVGERRSSKHHDGVSADNDVKPEEPPATIGSIFRQGRGVAAKQPVIRRLLLMVFVFGLGEEAIDRLGYQRFLEEGDFGDSSLALTGVLFVVLALTGAVIVRQVERRTETGTQIAVLAGGLVGLAAVGTIFVVFSPIIGIAAGLMMQDAAREALSPVTTSWANPFTDQQSRATVHSFLSLANGLGVAIGGLCAAAIAVVGGVSPALLWSVAAFMAAGFATVAVLRVTESAESKTST